MHIHLRNYLKGFLRYEDSTQLQQQQLYKTTGTKRLICLDQTQYPTVLENDTMDLKCGPMPALHIFFMVCFYIILLTLMVFCSSTGHISTCTGNSGTAMSFSCFTTTGFVCSLCTETEQKKHHFLHNFKQN